MKKFNLSLVAVLAMSTFALAGGDIAPVEPVIEETPVEYDASAFYIGIGYSGMQADLDSNFDLIDGNSDTFNQVLLLAGYSFNKYVAIEGRYAFGTDNKDWNYGNWRHPLVTNQDISADQWNIFVKPMYPVTDNFDVYALLGYGETSFDFAWGETDMGDTGGFAWGVGVKYDFTDNWSMFVDYVDQEDGNLDDYHYDVRRGQLLPINFDLDFDTVSVGVNYTF